MIRILPVVILLSGCAGSAIQVEETDTTCTVSGTALSVDVRDQQAPEPNSQFDFVYQGENCDIHVWNGEQK